MPGPGPERSDGTVPVAEDQGPGLEHRRTPSDRNERFAGMSGTEPDRTVNGIRIKSMRGAGGLVENIRYTNITMKGVANPIGQIWSGAMMLDHLGYPAAHDAIVRAIERVTENGPRTPDMGGKATTREMGDAIVAEVGRL